MSNMILGSIGSIVGTITVSDIIERKMKNYDTIVNSPVDSVSIIMPAFNEEQFIEKAASSIMYQSIILEYPDLFEFIVVDNGSTDNTPYIADIFADKVVKSPKGKLNARNFGTDISKNNIIVAVDADIYYPFDWLNTLLKTFKDPKIVGVSGTILDYNFPNIPSDLYTIIGSINRVYSPTRMYGGNCAYYKSLFYQIGKFNENINQFNVKEMVKEEEKDFGDKLSNYGKVVYKFNAAGVHLGGMKTGCRMGYTSADICQNYRFGIERFG